MLTSTQIRQSFLDFFREKQHSIVPSSSLMPDSPNLLFTNAGMNQFVPIFLGETKADVSKWGGAIPGSDTRAADTQKCIRAGGKHNDLDDVGLDTYHHTFFEMLGNWSFGDYFKKEAITWAWELVIERWGFPANRLYATIYQPGPGDPAERDAEAWNFWAEKFRSVGLDPDVHIVNGNKKDNFWMMGETGPCGPCSELHVDLTPLGDTRGSLVNAGDARCIEIWNLVFIQFNANPDGTFTPLPAQHVDTGMGFERVTSIIQGTKNFSDFANAKISNYETDIFRPIFDELEKMSGKTYRSTLPGAPGLASESADAPSGVAGIVSGMLEKATGALKNPPNVPDLTAGVLNKAGDLQQLVSGVLNQPGGLQAFVSGAVQKAAGALENVSESLRDASREAARAAGVEVPDEESESTGKDGTEHADQIAIDVAFRVIADHIRTLSFAIADGIQPGNTDRNYVLRRILRRAVRYGRTLGFHEPFFYKLVAVLAREMGDVFPELRAKQKHVEEVLKREEEAFNKTLDRGIEVFLGSLPVKGVLLENNQWIESDTYIPGIHRISADAAFKLYDTYGFPLDLTELMARERGLTVDTAGFEKLMEEQRARARGAQKKQVIELSEIETKEPTQFVGYDELVAASKVHEVLSIKDRTAVVLAISPCYAEMGGQVGDIGILETNEPGTPQTFTISNTQKVGNTWLHFIEEEAAPEVGSDVIISVDVPRRRAIERHHTVTHILHWALHEVVSKEATQKGSFVGPDKLTFDFNSQALTPQQVRDMERLVNERIVENSRVSWVELPYADVRGQADIMQFFGDKYGETVRVVQIGGEPTVLNGFSMELCAGTHTRATGEIGLFRINAESAIAAGVRRIEAVAGLNAYDIAAADTARLHALATKIGTPLPELEKRIEAMLAQQKELEKALKAANQREAAGRARELIEKVEILNGTPAIIANLTPADAETLQTVADSLKALGFRGAVVLGGAANGSVSLVAAVTSEFTAKLQAGKIIQAISPRVGGKGGGKPDHARGGGKDPSQLNGALDHARTLLLG
ncbi:MAG: alaS [Chthoniobacter sp.]|nr:alaS [Chthoniobacter sp.]